jgi:pyruvate/2-oxoglutarate dehydrogenase complex dihydrolipoamide acyltransferase (E2) component
MKTSHPVSIVVPQLGQHAISCPITAIFSEVGQRVYQHDFLYEVTVQSVAVTIHAPVTGILKTFHKALGETCTAGENIGTIEVQ